VLDICCNSGGFAIYAKARGGASEVTGIDLDEDILEIAEKNARLNDAKVKFVQADLFPWLRDAATRGEQWDVVVLDPAKLTRDREQVIPALKKYNDMNKLAMSVVAPGGLLLSCSCTGLVSEEEFLDMLRRAPSSPGASAGAEGVRRRRRPSLHGAREGKPLPQGGAAAHPVGGFSAAMQQGFTARAARLARVESRRARTEYSTGAKTINAAAFHYRVEHRRERNRRHAYHPLPNPARRARRHAVPAARGPGIRIAAGGTRSRLLRADGQSGGGARRSRAHARRCRGRFRRRQPGARRIPVAARFAGALGAPVTLLVSLRDQRGYLYREGRRIAVTTVSTGKPGYDTPTGVFPIMEKQKVHYSNRYEGANGRPAPMPSCSD
jgi:SAM-dependent methyltransferase